MILELKFEHLNRLQEIAPKNFSFPDISSGLYCSQKALFNGDKLIGAALLKLTSEAILILDSAESEISRARAISEAFEQVPAEMAKFGRLMQPQEAFQGRQQLVLEHIVILLEL